MMPPSGSEPTLIPDQELEVSNQGPSLGPQLLNLPKRSKKMIEKEKEARIDAIVDHYHKTTRMQGLPPVARSGPMPEVHYTPVNKDEEIPQLIALATVDTPYTSRKTGLQGAGLVPMS